jgi:hypothetical protein
MSAGVWDWYPQYNNVSWEECKPFENSTIKSCGTVTKFEITNLEIPVGSKSSKWHFLDSLRIRFENDFELFHFEIYILSQTM